MWALRCLLGTVGGHEVVPIGKDLHHPEVDIYRGLHLSPIVLDPLVISRCTREKAFGLAAVCLWGNMFASLSSAQSRGKQRKATCNRLTCEYVHLDAVLS